MPFAFYSIQTFSIAQYLDFFLRVIIACVCGGLIGYERSRRFKEAGLRTHIIVCCAAAFMMIVSKYGFTDLAVIGGSNMSVGTADPARIAAQIITGVSFLGAGIIFHNGNNSVKGLSTAAGVWATAGIGMAIGAGMYILGLFVTFVMFFVQWLVRKYEREHDTVFSYKIEFTFKNVDGFKDAFNEYVALHNIQTVESSINIDDEDFISYSLKVRSQEPLKIEELHGMLEKTGEVKNISFISM